MRDDEELLRAKSIVGDVVILDFAAMRNEEITRNPNLLQIVNLVDQLIEGIPFKEAEHLLEVLSSQIDSRIDNLREE